MPDLFGDTTGLPATTSGGIYYEIASIDYSEQWVAGANRTVVVCRIDYENVYDWVTAMVGRSYKASVSGTMRLRRDLPEANPFVPTQYCTKVEELDQGGGPTDDEGPEADAASGWPIPKWTRYRVTFEGLPFAARTDDLVDAASGFEERELARYCVRSQRCVAKEQQYPGGGFYELGDTTNKLQATGFKTIVMGEVSYTAMRWPVDDLPSARKTLRGRINDAVWDNGVGGYGWAAGTLLYVGFDDTNRYWDANGQWVCDIVYQFRARILKDPDDATGLLEYGWNYYLNKATKPVEVTTTGTGAGTRPYMTGDFNTLFRL